MDSKNGWVSIHRKILNWEWWDDTNVFRVFLYLLIDANHRDQKWKGILIKRGQKLTSLEKIHQQTNLTLQQIRTAIAKLKSTGEITCQSTSQYTLITINRYDEYQKDNKQSNKPITNEQQTNNKRATTNNNVNNVNNENKYIYTLKNFKSQKKIILEESMVKYPNKNCSKAIQDFIEYCDTKKTNYKNYKLAFFKWVRDDRFDQYSFVTTDKPQNLNSMLDKLNASPRSSKMQSASDILNINKK